MRKGFYNSVIGGILGIMVGILTSVLLTAIVNDVFKYDVKFIVPACITGILGVLGWALGEYKSHIEKQIESKVDKTLFDNTVSRIDKDINDKAGQTEVTDLKEYVREQFKQQENKLDLIYEVLLKK